MTKIIELRQDRGLICANFDGYKLSLDPIPLLRQGLATEPFKAEPNEDQYSFLHTELFSMQNLLHVDPWARTQAYFVNCSGGVVRSAYNENSGRPEALQTVYRVPTFGSGGDDTECRKKGDYNYTLRFISEKFCVLCDGIQHLFLLDTGDRLKAAEWKLVTQTTIRGDDMEDRDFLLYDCRLDTIQEEKQISVALGRVQRVELDSNEGGCNHYLHIHWAKWVFKEQQWVFNILETLESKGSLYYCAFEPRAESLVICSNREFILRSQKEKLNLKIEETPEERAQLHGSPSSNEISGFTWTQTDEDVLLKFDIKTQKEGTEYSVKCTTKWITVKSTEGVLLDSELFHKVQENMTTFIVNKDSLEVSMFKETPSLFWPSLLANDVGPKESRTQDNAQSHLRPVANLEAPIEECDFPMGTLDEEIKIFRIQLASRSITHTVLLGSSPPLFSTSLRPGFPPALATRQDVDASLWLQQYNPSKLDDWSLRHEGNLHAFGYVQASKEQRKFIDCSPDLSYALICESHRHVFLYKSKYDTADGLRNRNGPQVSIGKQHLVTLDDVGEILGLATAPSVVTLLTRKFVLFLQIN